MKELNELRSILMKNNRHAILDTESDIINELDRLDTSREINFDTPQPDKTGSAETIGTTTIRIGHHTVRVYKNVYLYDWDEEEKTYLEMSANTIGWEEI